jgi:hypothetical protein
VSAVIPGVGPVLTSGLLASALGGALTGLAGGDLVGALIGLEIPEEEARGYEREFHSGRTIVTVRAGERYDEAAAILQQAAQASLPAGHTLSRSARAADGDGGRLRAGRRDNLQPTALMIGPANRAAPTRYFDSTSTGAAIVGGCVP